MWLSTYILVGRVHERGETPCVVVHLFLVLLVWIVVCRCFEVVCVKGWLSVVCVKRSVC